jgi:aminomethyltransferase
MGYIDTGHADIDTEIYIEVRDKQLKARVVKFPFQ